MKSRFGRRLSVSLAALAGFAAVATSAEALTPTVTEFTGGVTPGFLANTDPVRITPGPDGNLWFTAAGNPGRVFRITPGGTVTEMATGGVTPNFTANGVPFGIATGPDGNLWVAEEGGVGHIARITPAGAVTETAGGTSGMTSGADPLAIAAGPDGNMWFTQEADPGRLAKITMGGVVTEVATGGVTPNFSPNATPYMIAAGSDGNLWVTGFEDAGHLGHVWRATTGGAVTEFTGGSTPNFAASSNPEEITVGPDGNLWFTLQGDPGTIDRITPAGAVTEMAKGGVTPGFSANSTPQGIAAGPDGAIWFTENARSAIGRLAPDGTVTEFTGGVYPGLSAGGNPATIVAGPDGNMWVSVELDPGRIIRITTPPAATTGAAAVSGAGAATVTGTLNGRSQPSSYRFDFGTTAGYGSSTPATPAGASAAEIAATAKLTGLTPGTTYHYRLVATNPTDSAFGADATLTTPPLPSVGPVRLSRKTWRRGSKLVQIARKRRVPVGTKITFALNRAAPVKLAFLRAKPGRKVGSRCRPVTRRNRRAKRCSRLAPAGTIAFQGHEGTNTVRFQGRLTRRKRLAPGSYQLKVTATDPTAPTPSVRTARFRVVKG